MKKLEVLKKENDVLKNENETRNKENLSLLLLYFTEQNSQFFNK